MEFFKDNAVKFFGINTKITAPAETEIKNVDIKTNYTDYLFHTEDGGYLHFEFQTTDKKEDIKRFLYYDASLFYKEKRKVRTVVIYSADIDDAEVHIDAGSIKYDIEAFYMKNLNGDEKLQMLKNKIRNKEKLDSEDILTLSFIPLMKSKISKSQRSLEGIELANSIEEDDTKLQCLTLLYALFDKFGDSISKIRFKEVFSMTDIGKMIREDGLKEGIEVGKEAEKTEILIKLLVKKFKKLPTGYEEKVRKLPMATLDIIITEIFDLESLEDLNKYL
ncbi:DUF4351 domain-containing protein [Clostridium folliculivorans]|uniref:DUF4351 domain-containing protein n=1 Tax=Clostridium folliculivorans TaxID=2886038 RepID=A0A9W5Y0C9_9CLOT|nr:DUF4351 domain-containing protein [Clostridium folliculivorans]GKU24278.1 hypothetical protein CFOLD11_11040 [Clostridium folliculivorans]GKU30383.1 hypothetical protein CFB3_24900 [Clostridium folliculivorans]